MTNSAEPGSALRGVLRVIGLGLMGLCVLMAVLFAFAAAVVIGMVVAGAALALRWAPRAKQAEPEILNARRTPTGWVVEASASHI